VVAAATAAAVVATEMTSAAAVIAGKLLQLETNKKPGDHSPGFFI